MPRLIPLAIVFAAAAFVVAVGASNAQYPPPRGSVTLTADDPTPDPGSSVQIACHVRNAGGAAVQGENCVFLIESRGGTAASLPLEAVVAVTDAAGMAYTTLYTGTQAGVVVIKVEAGGLSSALVMEVLSAVSPPAAPLEITPPSTGDGGLASGS